MQTGRIDVNNLLAQMREMKAQASGQQAIQPRSDVEAAVGSNKAQAPNFSDMFSNAINQVNETQKTSSALAKAYEQGDPSVTLSQVMVASQKSSVAFQAVTEVRNKLVEAYKDVMSMPL
jgi:flagellar hook-basal body complex protein FliE